MKDSPELVTQSTFNIGTSKLIKKNPILIKYLVIAGFLILGVFVIYNLLFKNPSLDAQVHTAGNYNFNASIYNKTLSNLKIRKNLSKSQLIITFNFDYKEPNRNMGWLGQANLPRLLCTGYFLIRLFDKNGNYLTHFTTEPFYKLLGLRMKFKDPQTVLLEKSYIKKQIKLVYDVNSRDLEFAQIAEFGFSTNKDLWLAYLYWDWNN